MLCVDDGDEGELQQTKAIHPWKSIVHNIGTLADTHRKRDRQRVTKREGDRQTKIE